MLQCHNPLSLPISTKVRQKNVVQTIPTTSLFGIQKINVNVFGSWNLLSATFLKFGRSDNGTELQIRFLAITLALHAPNTNFATNNCVR